MAEDVVIKINQADAYDQVLSLRRTGREGRSIEITIPKPVIRRYARKHGISEDKVAEKLRARVLYDDFGLDGIFVKFEESGGGLDSN